jgi:hypothetical protein
MSKLREKAEARTKQFVGQMINDDKLVREGTEQEKHAEKADDSPEDASQRRPNRNQRSE